MTTAVNPYDHRPIRLNGREYLPGPLAQEYVGRSNTTMWDWRRRGWVDARKVLFADGRERWVYSKGSLRVARRKAAESKSNQRHVAGPGRGRSGKRDAAALAEAQERAERRRADRERAEAERRAELRRRAEEHERLDDELYRLAGANG